MLDTEKTVEVTQSDSVSVDAVQDQATDSTPNDLEQFLMAEEAEAHEADAQEVTEAETVQADKADNEVPKGIKGRIQAAEAKADKRGYDRGRDEAMREFESYKQQMAEAFKELEEFKLERDAKKLAEQEHCSIGLAKRILRAEKGVAPAQETPVNVPARDEKGRFTANAGDEVQRRAEDLMKQAQSIKTAYGADVLETFRNDKAVQEKVGSGEWDMRDVYIHMLKSEKQTKPNNTVRPVRSGGGQNTYSAKGIRDLSSKGFDALNESIRKGKTFRFD